MRPALLLAQNASQARQMLCVADALERRGRSVVLCAADHLVDQPDSVATVLVGSDRDVVAFPFRRWGVERLRPGLRKFRPVPGPRTLGRLLAGADPQVVVVGNDARPSSTALLRAARAARVPTVLVQDGVRAVPVVDHAAGRGRAAARRERLGALAATPGDYGGFGCDRVAVMSDSFAAQLVAGGFPEDRIDRTGFVLYDRLVNEPPGPRPDVLPADPFALYAAQPIDVPVATLIEHYVAVHDACRSAGVRLVVKAHPRDRLLPTLAGELTRHRPGLQVVTDVAPADAIRASTVVLTFFSTMALEALVLGVPVVALTSLPLEFRLDLGEAAPVVASDEELPAVLDRVVNDPVERAARLRAGAEVARTETHSTDGRAAERVADAIIRAAADGCRVF
jgi:glycosyltransferase involved in cell wall biosynthesis